MPRPENRMTPRKIACPYSMFLVTYSMLSAMPNRIVEAITTTDLCLSQTDSESSGAWAEHSLHSCASVFMLMFQAHFHQFAYVLVREGVVHYPAITSLLDQVESPQKSELVGNSGYVHSKDR